MVFVAPTGVAPVRRGPAFVHINDSMVVMTALDFTVGVDEAGRGPLAGPVAVGVFAVSPQFDLALLNGIRDSKLLSAQQREEWYIRLTSVPDVRWYVSFSGPRYIDDHGIVPAITQALRRALRATGVDAARSTVLLDGGLRAPQMYRQQRTIIGGDRTEPLISAAAILAKVTRDRYMVRQARLFKNYGFERHKGYGTTMHYNALREHGLTPLHRATFCHVEHVHN
jgi:ribonuclease HII